MINRQIKIDVLLVGFAQGGVAALSLLLSVLLTHEIEPSVFGQYALITAIISSVVAIGIQWLVQSTNRFLPVVQSSQEEEATMKSIIVGLVFLNFAIVSFALLILSIIYYFMSYEIMIVVASTVVIVCSATFCVGVRVLQARFQSKSFGILMFCFTFTKVISILLGIYYIDKNVSIILWAEAFAYAVLLPVVWIKNNLSYKLLFFDIRSIKFALKGVARFWNYGALMTGWYVGSAIMMVGDRYLIGLLRNSSEVAIYTANYNLINGTIGLAAAPVLLVLHPYLMKYWAEKNSEDFAATLGKIVEWIWRVGIIIVGAFCIFSYDIAYYLFPSTYVSGHLVMPIAVMGILLWNLGLYIHKPLECGEKSGILMSISLCCAILNGLLNYLLIPRFGYLFAAVSTSITYMIYSSLSYIVGRKVVKWKFPFLGCLRILLPVACVTFAVWAIKGILITQMNRQLAVGFALTLYGVFAIVMVRNAKKSTLSGDTVACSS